MFPGFEREVATKVVSLISGQPESDTAAPTVKPTRRAVPKRTNPAERPPLAFPQREAVYEEALTQQLSLF